MKIFHTAETRLLVGGAGRNPAGQVCNYKRVLHLWRLGADFPTLWLAMPTLRSKIYQSLLCRAVGLPGPQSYKIAEQGELQV